MTDLFPTLNVGSCDDLNKSEIYKDQYYQLLNRCLNMFEWINLPEHINAKYLELYLLTNGSVALFPINNRYYITYGNYGGEPNEYYLPNYYVVANPYIPLVNNMLETYTDCVVCHNNSLITPLTTTIKKYATLLTENLITMKVACINSRMQTVISASDNQTIESANQYLSKLIDGKPAIIAENEFLQGVRIQPTTNNNRLLIDVIELQQYNKASFFHEIGINANYNMKREALNSNETNINEPSLKPLIYDMLDNRKKFCDAVNELYGLNIDVQLSPAWNELDPDELEELNELDPEDSDERDPDDQKGGEHEET